MRSTFLYEQLSVEPLFYESCKNNSLIILKNIQDNPIFESSKDDWITNSYSLTYPFNTYSVWSSSVFDIYTSRNSLGIEKDDIWKYCGLGGEIDLEE